MNTSTKSASIWHHSLILSSGAQPASISAMRPIDSDYGALDPRTFDAMEVDALFDVINLTQTHMGHLVLYRSLARPISDAQMLIEKQAAVRELESNPEMHDILKHFIENMAVGEKGLYPLLYGEFIGGLSSDEPLSDSNKLAFGGYGYRQYINGTRFVVDLVEAVNAFPQPQTLYLHSLFGAIRDFGRSRIYALMRGPVYLVDGKFKTQEEKPRFWPIPRFRPSMIKPVPMFIFMAAISAILYAFQMMLPELGASYMGYGILALIIIAIPVILLAIRVSDRDSIIYPLRKQFRHSQDLAKALEAMGMIDELLSFRRYASSTDGAVTLPDILDAQHHVLNVTAARNPLLDKTSPDFVPNDIALDQSERLLIITGPNSGGKTAYCKTVVQVQLLGQIGCYIPASRAQLVPVEHFFYQVPDPGRLDAEIGRFGHELKQTREIFFNATPRSLAVLDELSEGTTFEEKMTLSEYILKGFYKLGTSTLLVTHNHELCERLQGEGIGKYLQVAFGADGPTHQLIPGISRVSHAEHVATRIGFSKEDVEKHLAARRPPSNLPDEPAT